MNYTEGIADLGGVTLAAIERGMVVSSNTGLCCGMLYECREDFDAWYKKFREKIADEVHSAGDNRDSSSELH
jgi:hypothetical protein